MMDNKKEDLIASYMALGMVFGFMGGIFGSMLIYFLRNL